MERGFHLVLYQWCNQKNQNSIYPHVLIDLGVHTEDNLEQFSPHSGTDQFKLEALTFDKFKGFPKSNDK